MSPLTSKIIRFVFFGVLAFGIIISVNSSLYRKKFDSDWHSNLVRMRVNTVLQNNQFEIIANNAPPKTVLSFAIYYKSPTCSEKYILVPVSINLEADGYLSRIIPATYKIKYIFYNYESEKRNKTKFILMYLERLIYSKLGLSKHLALKTALVEATPQNCEASDIDWGYVWDTKIDEVFSDKDLNHASDSR